MAVVRSMTGFGRGESERDGIHCVVELKTVNHKFLEPSIRMSRKLAALENDLRTLLAQKVSRGKLDVYVTYERQESQTQLILHEEVLQEYLGTLRKVGEQYGLRDDLALSHVLTLPEVLEMQEAPEDTEAVWEVLKEAAERALDQLNAMRVREGARIRQDLLEKADLLESIVRGLEEIGPQVEENYRQKLEKRLEDILQQSSAGKLHLDEGILENEVALFADRCCIDEELVRLHSHIEQLRKLLDAEEPVGRPLDFLMQEFNREANTIGSKAGDLAVTGGSLRLKKEIEKVREQIQNLE